MCSHLDTILKDDVQKIELHQDFWRHRRNCVRCSGRVKQNGPIWQNSPCPLEHLVKRPPPPKEDVAKVTKITKVIKPMKGKDGDIRRLLLGSTKPIPDRPIAKPVVKKGPTEEELAAKGLVKVTYEVDDDFDAAGGTGVSRTVWIQDFSKMESGMEGKKVEEDDDIYEEIIIKKLILTDN
jgi:hypothetical protein